MKEVTTVYKAVVLAYFDKAVNVAKVLGFSSKSSVSQWGAIIPEKQALRLEKLTRGALKYDPSLYKKAA